jgi:hypothetical protein
MREYSEFFRFTPHAYLVTYVIYMAGIFETRRDTINLVSLIPEMKALGRLTDESAAAVETLMLSAKPIARKVAILRNNAIAHRNIEMSYNDVFKLAAVKPRELKDITDTALNIANRLLLACGLQNQHFAYLPRQDAANMMNALGRHTVGT